MTDPGLARTIELAWAWNAASVADHLRRADPRSRARHAELGDGLVVLSGPGLYVNRAFALGLTEPVDHSMFDELERLSADVGLPASLDLLPHADPSVGDIAGDRGYEADTDLDVFVWPLDDRRTLDASPDIVVEPVRDRRGLTEWQSVTAAGWGHRDGPQRSASDRYSAAAYAAGELQLIARDRHDRRPLGAAVVVLGETVAVLGGMSTLPEERRRGVQTAMVADRLRRARAAGCAIAATSAIAAGVSARNLARLGFDTAYRKQILERPATSTG